MSFVQLVQREMQGSLPRLLFMSALGGISTAAVLASINAGVQSVNGGNKPSLWAATLFLVALFLSGVGGPRPRGGGALHQRGRAERERRHQAESVGGDAVSGGAVSFHEDA